ncbi:AraC family transcriptional regulator [Lactonifactor longoviformis]|nr:AraC family transcriptional regulator [Lactonifactor longoviformis]
MLLKICKNKDIGVSDDMAGMGNQMLYLVYRNSIQILIEDELVTLFEGQVLLSKADISRKVIQMNSGYFQLLFSQAVTFKGKLSGEIFIDSGVYQVFEISEDLESCKFLCERMLREIEDENISRELADTLLEGVLSILCKTLSSKSSIQRDFIAITKEYIEKHYKENLSLSELADHVNVSVYHLSHMFKEEVGISPIQYAIFCRMEYAKKQLRETSCSVQKIAVELGYENPNYFNLLFKKTVGISPGTYRKEWKRR